jgi:DNA (cytosine-5)-methyltransferase 1
MRYLSVCSGIEAATTAWHPLGWQPAAFAEIDPFPSAVLAHHWPEVPNLGDMTQHHDWPERTGPIQLLVGGTPCQAFSVAGLRQGLADPRGNLTLTYLALVAQHRPTWVVWENVPGVLSDKTGAFGSFLGGLAELGYGWAYRVLDAQYYGVAQRRRRVFVVGCLGNWAAAAAVLFERESLLGHPPPRRTPGQSTTHDIAPCLAASGRGIERGGDTLGQDPVIAVSFASVGNAEYKGGSETLITHTLKGEGFDASEDGTGRGTPLVPCVSPTLRAGGNKTGGDRPPGTDVDTCESLIPVAFDTTQITSAANRSNPAPGDPCHPLAAGAHPPAIATYVSDPMQGQGFQPPIAFSGRARGDIVNALQAQSGGTGKGDAAPCVAIQEAVATAYAVRRLTPRECERLQGFPDDHTQIPYRGKPATDCPDGPRYKAIGNSMAVPVMAWIGQRIQTVHTLLNFP